MFLLHAFNVPHIQICVITPCVPDICELLVVHLPACLRVWHQLQQQPRLAQAARTSISPVVSRMRMYTLNFIFVILYLHFTLLGPDILSTVNDFCSNY